jgi:hypothetical protein
VSLFLALPVAAGGERLDAAIEALVAAYPDHLSHRDGNTLVWHDGSTMEIDDGVAKDHNAMLVSADIEDMLSQPYPVGACSYAAPAGNVEPGRIRAEAFFARMYGDSGAQVRARLAAVDWFGSRLQVTRVNGVDRALATVAAELAALPREMHEYFTVTAGTFNWRVVAGTQRLSVHSFGAAIDINVAFADYWKWQVSASDPDTVPAYRNRVPAEIVEAFERHGFIWGGKWHRYDTMHFEYRPELLALSVEAPCH